MLPSDSRIIPPIMTRFSALPSVIQVWLARSILCSSCCYCQCHSADKGRDWYANTLFQNGFKVCDTEATAWWYFVWCKLKVQLIMTMYVAVENRRNVNRIEVCPIVSDRSEVCLFYLEVRLSGWACGRSWFADCSRCFPSVSGIPGFPPDDDAAFSVVCVCCFLATRATGTRLNASPILGLFHRVTFSAAIFTLANI